MTGTKPGPRPLNAEEKRRRGVDRNRINEPPRPVPIAPSPPKFLRGRALKVWRQLAPELEQAGLLTSVDGPSFAVLCAAIAQHEAASAEIERDGVTVAGARGGIVRHPACVVQKDAAAIIGRFGAAFGLDPTSRSAMHSPIKASRSLEDLLAGVPPQ